MLSCDKRDCEPNTHTFTFSDNQHIFEMYDSIEQRNTYVIEEGDKLVFTYDYYHGHCDGSADDWYNKTLNFEIEKGLQEFNLKDSELMGAHCFVHHTSTWLYNYYPINEGTIEGHLLSDGSWDIKADVTYTIPLTFPQNERIRFHRIFE